MKLRAPLYGSGYSDGAGSGGATGLLLTVLTALVALELLVICVVVIMYVPGAVDEVTKTAKTISGMSSEVTTAVNAIVSIAANISAISKEANATLPDARSLIVTINNTVVRADRAVSQNSGSLSSLLQLFSSRSPPPPLFG